jgi:NAD+ diphosphatase
MPVRALFSLLSDEEMGCVGRAYQILHWEKTHRFCGRCGGRTVDAEGETAKRCLDCGFLSFPRISPAVIVAVSRGRDLLLVRAHRHKSGVYSNVAGFVEPGETLEDAVRRELAEEVRVSVRNIRYFGSQPWPFPHSLMVGFTAEYESGEIMPYEREIADARWFDIDHLPRIPDGFTIARRLIDHVIGGIAAPAAGKEEIDG